MITFTFIDGHNGFPACLYRQFTGWIAANHSSQHRVHHARGLNQVFPTHQRGSQRNCTI